MIETFSNIALMIIKLDVLSYTPLKNFSCNKLVFNWKLKCGFLFSTLLLSRFFSRGEAS